MSQLTVNVNDQALTITNSVLIASGGSGDDTVQFTFTGTHWNGFTMSGVFYRRENVLQYHGLLDENDVCTIPNQVLLDRGTIYIGLIGTNVNGVVKTSEVLRFYIEEGAISSQYTSVQPTPDIYTQLLAMYGGAQSTELLERAQALEDILDEIDALATTAVEAKNIAVSAKDTAVLAKDDAVIAKTASESARDISVTSKNTAVSAKDTAVSMKLAVESMLSGISGEGVYGCKFCITDVTSNGVRTRNAVGLTYTKYIGNSGTTQVESDFQAIGWWSLMKEVLTDPLTNEVVAVEGDSDYETLRDAKNHNMMMRYAKYYYDIIQTVEEGKTYVEFVMSLKPFKGSKVLDDFQDDDGNELPYSYHSCFDAGYKLVGAENKLVSQPDVVPTVNKSVPDFETEFASLGLRNGTLNSEYVWLIPLIIETASLNTQNSVGRGVCAVPFNNTDTYKVKEARTDSNEVVVLKSLGYQVGLMVQIGSSYTSWSIAADRTILSIADHGTDPLLSILTVDGATFSTTTESWCTAQRQPCGLDEKIAMGHHSGYYKKYTNESFCHAFVYGLCDPWGNVWEGLSNMLRYNGELWVNWTKGAPMATAVPADGWHKMMDANIIVAGSGWWKDWTFKFDDNGRLAIQPTSVGGNETHPVGDYAYYWDVLDLRIFFLGGHFYYGSSVGAFYLYCYTRAYTGLYFGARSVRKVV